MKSIRLLNFEVPEIWPAIRGITRQKSILVASILLFFSFTSLYLFISPDLASQPWDSLSYGYSAEVNGLSAMWGNHPLGHFIFHLIFNLAKGLGYQGRALIVFQVTNSALGGLTVAALFTFLVSIIKIRMPYALGFSLVLGASYGYWFFAGTADIYHFAILCALLAWAALTYEVPVRNHRFLLLSGLLTGFSILFHQLNVMLVPAGLALILFAPNARNPLERRNIEQAASFILSAFAVALSGYLLLGFIATSSISVTKVIGWMRGYFGDSTYGRYLNGAVLKTAWVTISQAVLFSPQTKVSVLSHGLVGFFLLIFVFGLFAQKVLDARKRAILKSAALECLITWPFILWWEPQNPKFWLLTLVPFVIFLVLSFEAVAIRLRDRMPEFGKGLGLAVNILPLLFGILILAMNVQHIVGDQDAVAFHEALSLWLNHSNPEDVIITAGDLIPQLRYWGNRPNTVFLYRALQASQTSPDAFYQLREQIDQALCSDHTVLFTPAASQYITDDQLPGVSRKDLGDFLDEITRRGKIAFWYRDLFDEKLVPVYAVRGTGACSSERSP